MTNLSGVELFVSYSHRDRVSLDVVKTHLVPLERDGLTVWDDQKISPGARWRETIQAALERAHLALLLVTPDFLASQFIDQHELPVLLNAAQAGRLRILWIHVRSSLYEHTEIEQYEALHDPSRPLAALSRPRREAALVAITRKIREALPAPASTAPTTKSPASVRVKANGLQEESLLDHVHQADGAPRTGFTSRRLGYRRLSRLTLSRQTYWEERSEFTPFPAL